MIVLQSDTFDGMKHGNGAPTSAEREKQIVGSHASDDEDHLLLENERERPPRY